MKASFAIEITIHYVASRIVYFILYAPVLDLRLLFTVYLSIGGHVEILVEFSGIPKRRSTTIVTTRTERRPRSLLPGNRLHITVAASVSQQPTLLEHE